MQVVMTRISMIQEQREELKAIAGDDRSCKLGWNRGLRGGDQDQSYENLQEGDSGKLYSGRRTRRKGFPCDDGMNLPDDRYGTIEETEYPSGDHLQSDGKDIRIVYTPLHRNRKSSGAKSIKNQSLDLNRFMLYRTRKNRMVTVPNGILSEPGRFRKHLS